MKQLKVSLFIITTFLLSASIMAQPTVPVDQLLERAFTLEGTPYVYGGTTPAGFDCSGFVYYSFLPWFNEMPRDMQEQINCSRAIEKEDLKPGDLIFFATVAGKTGATHVAIYIGNNKIIHAMSQGKDIGVYISDLDENYWKQRYLFSRRIIADDVMITEEKQSETRQVSEPEKVSEPEPLSGAQDNFKDWKKKDSSEFQEWLKTR